jgi:hypothetical protein
MSWWKISKKNLIIIVGSVLIFLGLLTVFVYKARGSNERNIVSGCVPYNVTVIKGQKEYDAIVEWYTQEECLGYISYGYDRKRLNSIALDNENLSSRYHSVLINKLSPSQTYFFLIHSGDNSYGNKGVPLSFSLSSL